MLNFLILITSGVVSNFILKEYNKYENIFFGFVICLILIGFPILHVYETHSFTFINTGYFNCLVIFKKIYNKEIYIFGNNCIFLYFSKAHFIILFPVVIIICINFRKKYQRKDLFISNRFFNINSIYMYIIRIMVPIPL